LQQQLAAQQQLVSEQQHQISDLQQQLSAQQGVAAEQQQLVVQQQQVVAAQGAQIAGLQDQLQALQDQLQELLGRQQQGECMLYASSASGAGWEQPCTTRASLVGIQKAGLTTLACSVHAWLQDCAGPRDGVLQRYDLRLQCCMCGAVFPALCLVRLGFVLCVWHSARYIALMLCCLLVCINLWLAPRGVLLLLSTPSVDRQALLAHFLICW
jgi:hypothetical protein